MSQVQKLFTRWIVTEITHVCDAAILNEQHGFRRARQAPEVMHSMLRILESQQEWGGHITVVKLDLQKAFDTVYQSAILQGLFHPRTSPLCSCLAQRAFAQQHPPRSLGNPT